jgi:oligoribonuclease NrnB/cAMP/cGMP phosphodiesterase (DHH superfamily)
MIQSLMRRESRMDSLRRGLAKRKSHVIHLTHNDLDAVGADAVHRLRYGEVFTVFTSVGAFPQMLSILASEPGNGDLLSITDFGFQSGIEKTLHRVKAAGWRVEWRDHHRWREDEIAAVLREGVLLHVDTTTCATGIAARELTVDNAHTAEVAKVVCDYDLWKNEDPRSMVLGRIVSKEENRVYVRDCLVAGRFTDERIEIAYRELTIQMEEMVEKSIRHARVYGGTMRIAFAPLYGYPSETAYALRNRLGSEIEVIVSRSGRFSIRSVRPVSHIIAREFGGGGHPHAAGGSFSFTLPEKVWFFLFKKAKKFHRLVTVAESLE